MTLYDKILQLYPHLTVDEFGLGGTIRLENALDERGDYIAFWAHPEYPKPTQEQLDAIQ